MAGSGPFTRARVFLLAAALSIATLFAIAAGGVAAADHFAWPADLVVLDAPASLALDRVGHQLLLDAAPPNSPAFLAFVADAKQHQLFIGGGFVNGTAPLLT